MQTGLHAVGWGLQRLALVLAALVLAVMVSYVIWVFVLIAIQGYGALKH